VLLLCAPVALAFLAGCMQAHSLGDEAPAEVVIAGTPTWSNGVAQLTGLKCAVCHRVPRPEISPVNVTDDLDLTLQSAMGALCGAEDIAPFLQAGVLRQDVAGIPHMPLPFAAPLTDRERVALEPWAAGISPSSGAALYAANCQECHGVNGTGKVGTKFQRVSVSNIDLAIANVPQMLARPWLAALSETQRQATSTFLQ